VQSREGGRGNKVRARTPRHELGGGGCVEMVFQIAKSLKKSAAKLEKQVPPTPLGGGDKSTGTPTKAPPCRLKQVHGQNRSGRKNNLGGKETEEVFELRTGHRRPGYRSSQVRKVERT